MFEKYVVLVRGLGLSLPVAVGGDVEQLVLVLAGTLGVLALGNVHVNHADHGCAVARLRGHSVRKVTHVVDLDERLNVHLELVHVLLHQLFDP